MSLKQTQKKLIIVILFQSGGLILPKTEGAHPHTHDEDDIFFVIEGVMSFLIEDKWIDAERESFVLAPGGVIHGFENRSDKKAAVLNISIPGGFEKNMPMITNWYKENPPRSLEK